MLIFFNENKVSFSHTIPFSERFVLILQLWVETLEGEADLAAALSVLLKPSMVLMSSLALLSDSIELKMVGCGPTWTELRMVGNGKSWLFEAGGIAKSLPLRPQLHKTVHLNIPLSFAFQINIISC